VVIRLDAGRPPNGAAAVLRLDGNCPPIYDDVDDGAAAVLGLGHCVRRNGCRGHAAAADGGQAASVFPSNNLDATPLSCYGMSCGVSRSFAHARLRESGAASLPAR